jgi:hypothetical protein
MYTIQVKTISYRNPTGKITDLMAEYLIVVVLNPIPKSYAHKVDTELRAEVSRSICWLTYKIYEQYKSIEEVIGRGNE